MNKEGKVELYRFWACIFIMIGHYVYYTGSTLNIPFYVSYQFVEFFFYVSGFFTAKHFDVKWNKNDGFQVVAKYYLKKFLRFLPYTIPAIIGVYAVESQAFISVGDMEGFWNNLKDIVLEITYLSVFRASGAHLFIMWFLSAMFVTMPFLILFFMIKRKWVKIVIGTIAPLLYYILSPDYSVQEPVNQLLRAFFGMMLGGTIYYLSCFVKEKETPVHVKWIFTALFIVAYVLPIVFSYKNLFLTYEYIICFVLWLFILMSDLIKIGPWHSRVLGYLGDISMPIFIWHITIFKFVKAFNICDDNEILRMILSVVAVLAISVLNMTIVRICKKYSQKA